MRDKEHAEQVALIKWADNPATRRVHPCLEMLFAVPNGGHRHPAVAGKLKAEGVRRGVQDLFLDVPRGGHHGLRIELKANGGRLSNEQKEWIDKHTRHGYRAICCFGWLEAKNEILRYLHEY